MSEPIVLVLKKFIVEEMERVQLNNQTNDVPLDIEEIDEEDFKFVYDFLNLYDNFFLDYYNHIKPDHELTEHMDWSTNAVGTFFIKNLKQFKNRCEVGKDFNSTLHQLFTQPKQNLSLPNIASLYSANDFSALATEKDFDDETLNQSN